MKPPKLAVLVLAGLLLPFLIAAKPSRTRLQGPITDFWNQVKREWAQSIPGLRKGPSQTYQWISLVYGSPGEDEFLDNLLEHEMRTWASLMERQWIRSMFWKKSYERLRRDSFYGSRALRKNLVVMGTPSSNPLLDEMTQGTPFSVDDGGIQIGSKRYQGTSLVLAFIRPNPLGENSYVLVLAASNQLALLSLTDLSLGPTDYVLFRGSHIVESGFLDWSDPQALTLAGGRLVNPDHQGWEELATDGVRVHYHPAEFSRHEVESFGEERALELEALQKFVGTGATVGWDEYLYPSLDVKMRHTSAPDPVSVDLAGAAIHRVWRPGQEVALWPAAMLQVWRHWGVTDLTGLLYGLSFLPGGELEGQSLQQWAGRLEGRRELRRAETLIPQNRFHGEDGARNVLQVLGLGAFLEHLAETRGRETVQAFYRKARRRNFRRVFRDIMGTSITRAETTWRRGLKDDGFQVAASPASSTPAPSSRVSQLMKRGESAFLERRDQEAAKLLSRAIELDPGQARARVLLARIAFRGDRDEEAILQARSALKARTEDPFVAAWARTTLGRALATQGNVNGARLELTDPAVAQGPDSPRRLADYWLETLGLSPNHAMAARYLSQQAELDLQRYDWDTAEKRVLRILSADPGNADAHHLLARVRLNKYRYWHDFAMLYNELFPGTIPSDPQQYFFLAQSSAQESRKGALLESGEYTPIDIDLGDALDPTPGAENVRGPRSVFVPRAAIGGDQHQQHFLRAEGFFLARDWKRAASNLTAILEIGIPVSNFRALVLYRLALCEFELDQPDEARKHLEEAASTTRDRAHRNEMLQLLKIQESREDQSLRFR